MKIIINTSWGIINDFHAATRTDPKFIEDVETGRYVGDFDEHDMVAEVLKVVEIPDNATDYAVLNYDGQEIVVFVVDGKLYRTENEDCRIFDDFKNIPCYNNKK